jgi:hypothetical protein
MRGDASDFKVEDAFGLAVSTYDSLNHLPDERSLEACFHCVLKVCEGIFIFDLNTRHGLRRWNGFSLDDSDDELLVGSTMVRDREPGHGLRGLLALRTGRSSASMKPSLTRYSNSSESGKCCLTSDGGTPISPQSRICNLRLAIPSH